MIEEILSINSTTAQLKVVLICLALPVNKQDLTKPQPESE